MSGTTSTLHFVPESPHGSPDLLLSPTDSERSVFSVTAPRGARQKKTKFVHTLGGLSGKQHFIPKISHADEDERFCSELSRASGILYPESKPLAADNPTLKLLGPRFHEAAQHALEQPLTVYGKPETWVDWMKLRAAFLAEVRPIVRQFRFRELPDADLEPVGASVLHRPTGLLLHQWESVDAAKRYSHGFRDLWRLLFEYSIRGIFAPVCATLEVEGRVLSVAAVPPWGPEDGRSIVKLPVAEVPQSLQGLLAQHLLSALYLPLDSQFALSSGLDGRLYLTSMEQVNENRVSIDEGICPRWEARHYWSISTDARKPSHVSAFITLRVIPEVIAELYDEIGALKEDDRNSSTVVLRQIVPKSMHLHGANLVYLAQLLQTMSKDTKIPCEDPQVKVIALEAVRTEIIVRLLKSFARADLVNVDDSAEARCDVVNRLIRLLMSKDEEFWNDHVLPGLSRKYKMPMSMTHAELKMPAILKGMVLAMGCEFDAEAGKFVKYSEVTSSELCCLNIPAELEGSDDEQRRAAAVATWSQVDIVPDAQKWGSKHCALTARGATLGMVLGTGRAVSNRFESLETKMEAGLEFPLQHFELCVFRFLNSQTLASAKRVLRLQQLDYALQQVLEDDEEIGNRTEAMMAFDGTLALMLTRITLPHREETEFPRNVFIRALNPLLKFSPQQPCLLRDYVFTSIRELLDDLSVGDSGPVLEESDALTAISMFGIGVPIVSEKFSASEGEWLTCRYLVALGCNRSVTGVDPQHLIDAALQAYRRFRESYGIDHPYAVFPMLAAACTALGSKPYGKETQPLEWTRVALAKIAKKMVSQGQGKLACDDQREISEAKNTLTQLYRAQNWISNPDHIDADQITREETLIAIRDYIRKVDPTFSAVMQLQKVGKGFLPRQRLRDTFSNILLGRTYRVQRIGRGLIHRSVVYARKCFLAKEANVMVLQRLGQGLLARKQCGQDHALAALVSCTTALQRVGRGYTERAVTGKARAKMVLLSKVELVQRVGRGLFERSRVSVEWSLKAKLSEEERRERHAALLESSFLLQRIGHGFTARRDLRQRQILAAQLRSTRIVQTCGRGLIARSQLGRDRLKMKASRSSCDVLQRLGRGYLYRTEMSTLQRDTAVHRLQNTTFIQRVGRGYMIRAQSGMEKAELDAKRLEDEAQAAEIEEQEAAQRTKPEEPSSKEEEEHPQEPVEGSVEHQILMETKVLVLEVLGEYRLAAAEVSNEEQQAWEDLGRRRSINKRQALENEASRMRERDPEYDSNAYSPGRIRPLKASIEAEDSPAARRRSSLVLFMNQSRFRQIELDERRARLNLEDIEREQYKSLTKHSIKLEDQVKAVRAEANLHKVRDMRLREMKAEEERRRAQLELVYRGSPNESSAASPLARSTSGSPKHSTLPAVAVPKSTSVSQQRPGRVGNEKPAANNSSAARSPSPRLPPLNQSNSSANLSASSKSPHAAKSQPPPSLTASSSQRMDLTDKVFEVDETLPIEDQIKQLSQRRRKMAALVRQAASTKATPALTPSRAAQLLPVRAKSTTPTVGGNLGPLASTKNRTANPLFLSKGGLVAKSEFSPTK